MNWLIVSIVIIIGFVVACAFKWLFDGYGLDKIRHPEEWKDAGLSGERTIYRTLIDEIHVPENQILRNVYIPDDKNGTSEIDLLVISKKGIFVFEVKNYGGKVYGDMKRKKWIQYIGGKKSYFYNPFRQNRTHCNNLKKLIAKYGEAPVISLVTTIRRGEWKIRNLGPEDYFLGYNCHFKDIYDSLPTCEQMAKAFKPIMELLTPLSRPTDDTAEKHVAKIRQH